MRFEALAGISYDPAMSWGLEDANAAWLLSIGRSINRVRSSQHLAWYSTGMLTRSHSITSRVSDWRKTARFVVSPALMGDWWFHHWWISMNGDSAKWMVCKGKSSSNGWCRDTPILGNPHLALKPPLNQRCRSVHTLDVPHVKGKAAKEWDLDVLLFRETHVIWEFGMKTSASAQRSVTEFSHRCLGRMVPLELRAANVTWALGHGHKEFRVSNLAFENNRSKLA